MPIPVFMKKSHQAFARQAAQRAPAFLTPSWLTPSACCRTALTINPPWLSAVKSWWFRQQEVAICSLPTAQRHASNFSGRSDEETSPIRQLPDFASLNGEHPNAWPAFRLRQGFDGQAWHCPGFLSNSVMDATS
jgi:hypothetical protein